MSDKIEKKEKKESNDTIIHIITAVLVVVVIVATAVVSINGKKETGATDASSQQAQETQEAAQPEGPFASWAQGSPALAQIEAYVTDVCNPDSPNFVEPKDRIATFDMDGTIMCEKAPIYFDWMMLCHRVLNDPEFPATELERANMQQIFDHACTYGETLVPPAPNKDTLITSAFAGMTQKQFREYVLNFADNTPAIGFSGMTYAQAFYRPMLEIIDYLRANEFDVWMVSACEREVTRALGSRIGIPLDHVIATDPVLRTTGQLEVPADQYTMDASEEVVLWDPLQQECGKTAKTLAIAREIGQRPIIAFGNSTGDYSMLNYAKGNPDHVGMGVLIVADDEVREYGNFAQAQEIFGTVAQSGWVGVSMATDWATIYGDGVMKTGLPLAQAPEATADPAAEVPAEPAPVEEYADAA